MQATNAKQMQSDATSQIEHLKDELAQETEARQTAEVAREREQQRAIAQHKVDVQQRMEQHKVDVSNAWSSTRLI